MSIKEAFGPLLAIADKASRLDILELFAQVAETKEFKDFVIFLNQEGQLELGVNSKGERLEDVRKDKPNQGYSNSYKKLRQRRGLPTDRITLNFSGRFRDSFTVDVDREVNEILITINANTIKQDKDLRNVWGNEILGLSDESIQVLIDFTKEAIQKSLRKYLGIS